MTESDVPDVIVNNLSHEKNLNKSVINTTLSSLMSNDIRENNQQRFLYPRLSQIDLTT